MYKDMDWNLKKLGTLLSFNAMPAKNVNHQKSYYGFVLLTVKCISAVFEDGTFKGIANALTSLY